MRRIAYRGCIEGTAARRKLQIMDAFGHIFDDLEHGVLQIGVELALDRQVNGTVARQGIEVHGLTRGELLPRLVQVETNEVADLVAFDVNDLTISPRRTTNAAPSVAGINRCFLSGIVLSSFGVSLGLPRSQAEPGNKMI